MTGVLQFLPRPDHQLVRRLTDEFDSIYGVAERALARLFATYPSNAVREEILLKVVAVNQLYGTQVYAVRELADHIHGLEIDGLLRDGAPEAVELIAGFEIKGRPRRLYSFATKYCSWHAPERFPIYDSFVDRSLWLYRQQTGFSKLQRANLRHYALFREAVNDFRTYFNLTGVGVKELDKALWMLGKAHEPNAGG